MQHIEGLSERDDAGYQPLIRIANALERIADALALEPTPAPPLRDDDGNCTLCGLLAPCRECNDPACRSSHRGVE